MKRLLDENDIYTKTGSDLYYEIDAMIRPLIQWYMKQNYSYADVQQIIHDSIDMIIVGEKAKRILKLRMVKNGNN